MAWSILKLNIYTFIRNSNFGTSLVVQWLRLRAPNAGGPGSNPGQGSRSHIPQLKILYVAMKILCARCSQINK